MGTASRFTGQQHKENSMRSLAPNSFRALLLASILVIGCSQNDSGSLGALSQEEAQQETVDVAAGAVALETGGFLESLESVLVGDAEGAPSGLDGLKDRHSDEAVFDSAACLWTITNQRAVDNGDAGFNWNTTGTLHFMDAEGGCVEQRGDSLIRSLDLTRAFSGTHWSPRREGSKSGGGSWALVGIHDDVEGSLANGTHMEEGEGTIHRVMDDGTVREVAYTFTLNLVGTDLLLIHRAGRRVPIGGTVTGVYDGTRGDRVIHREFTIEFNEGGGRIDLGDGVVLPLNPVTGATGN